MSGEDLAALVETIAGRLLSGTPGVSERTSDLVPLADALISRAREAGHDRLAGMAEALRQHLLQGAASETAASPEPILEASRTLAEIRRHLNDYHGIDRVSQALEDTLARVAGTPPIGKLA